MSHAMPELDDQHPPSHKGRIPDVPAGGQCRKAPIDAPDDVRHTTVGPDLVAWVADHHFVELRPSICAVLWFSHRRLAPHRRLGRLSARMDGPLKPSAAVGGRRFSVPV